MVVSAAIAALGLPAAWGQDMLRIPLPIRSRLTPVQRLNREGVKAVTDHHYKKAANLFYKAYLYDPSDPFTLNNLGYISELQGRLAQANKFYKLASEQGCKADIDLSNVQTLEGKPMKAALQNLHETSMQVNRMNVDAMNLLSEGRSFEAASLLQHALALKPHDPFTLNNLGVANEAVGNYSAALRYYRAAAGSHSSAAVVVTQKHSWSGKPISEMAATNARQLRNWIKRKQISQNAAQAAFLNRRGVFAENENDQAAAKRDFLHAYSLDPKDAFSLNNRGYVAEMNGDLESAQYFYKKARHALDAHAHVGLATNNLARGETLSQVATGSTWKMRGALATYSRERRSQTGPIKLTPRNGASLVGAPAPSKPASSPQAGSSGRAH